MNGLLKDIVATYRIFSPTPTATPKAAPFVEKMPPPTPKARSYRPVNTKTQAAMRRSFSLLALLPLLLLPLQPATACTIVSAVAKDGQVWNMNNEDGPAGIANFINVFPRTAGQAYGYYTLSYLTPGAGAGGNAQGGMNEAGLTFDFNAIDYVEAFDPASRQAYPGGNDAILAYIMGTMRSVDEVIAFFATYWFVDGFRGAQMHVADRDGKFAIISASGVQVAPEGEPLVSTNFDLCGKEDDSSCWRYPPRDGGTSRAGGGFGHHALHRPTNPAAQVPDGVQ